MSEQVQATDFMINTLGLLSYKQGDCDEKFKSLAWSEER
jgi:hypothetical protein